MCMLFGGGTSPLWCNDMLRYTSWCGGSVCALACVLMMSTPYREMTACVVMANMVTSWCYWSRPMCPLRLRCDMAASVVNFVWHVGLASCVGGGAVAVAAFATTPCACLLTSVALANTNTNTKAAAEASACMWGAGHIAFMVTAVRLYMVL